MGNGGNIVAEKASIGSFSWSQLPSFLAPNLFGFIKGGQVGGEAPFWGGFDGRLPQYWNYWETGLFFGSSLFLPRFFLGTAGAREAALAMTRTVIRRMAVTVAVEDAAVVVEPSVPACRR